MTDQPLPGPERAYYQRPSGVYFEVASNVS
jgi:hypothetical protein